MSLDFLESRNPLLFAHRIAGFTHSMVRSRHDEDAEVRPRPDGAALARGAGALGRPAQDAEEARRRLVGARPRIHYGARWSVG